MSGRIGKLWQRLARPLLGNQEGQQTRVKKAVTTMGGLGIAQGIVVVCGVVSAALLARNFSQETYGGYQLVLAWIGMIGPLCLTGLRETLKIAAAREYHGNIAIVYRYWGLAVGAGALALAILALSFWQSDPVLAGGLLVGALLFPLSRLESVWTSWMTAARQFRKLSTLRIIKAGISVLGIALLVLSGVTGLIPLVAIAIGLPGLVGIYSVVQIYRQRQNEKRDPESMRYGLHVSAASTLEGLMFSDRLIVGMILSKPELAIWAIALAFPTQVKVFANILLTYMAPAIYRSASILDGWRILKKALPLILAAFVVMGIAGYLAIPVLIPLVFSEKYIESIPYGKLLWITACMIIPINTLDQIMRAHQKKLPAYGQNIGYPLLILALTLALYHHGLTGVLAARIIAYVALFVFLGGLFIYYAREERKRQHIDARHATRSEPDS